jgi:hypothetical protein
MTTTTMGIRTNRTHHRDERASHSDLRVEEEKDRPILPWF